MNLHSTFISLLLTEKHHEKWFLNKNNRLFLSVLCNRWQQPVWLNGRRNAPDRELHLLLPHPLSAALHGAPAAPEAERAHWVLDWSKLWVSALTCACYWHTGVCKGEKSHCLAWLGLCLGGALPTQAFVVDSGKIFFVCGLQIWKIFCVNSSL